MKQNINRLIHFLSKNKKTISPLLILTHNYPDPDAIASAFALAYFVKHVYKIESKIVYGGIISRFENRYMVDILNIPCQKLKQSDFKKYEHVALVDTQPGFGNNSFPKSKRATIVIDQHPYVRKPSVDLLIVDPNCGATCEIIARVLLFLKIAIPKDVATALIYGLLSDTLNLYRIERKDVFRTYYDLLPYCNMEKLAEIQNTPRPAEFFTVLQRGIQYAKAQGKLIFSHLKYVSDPVFIAHTADFLLRYKGIRWSFCTGRHKGRLYVSLRTNDHRVLAYEVIRDIFEDRSQAGGHGTIAGGSLDVGKKVAENIWKKKEKQLTFRLIDRLKLSKRAKFYYPF